MFDPPHFSCAEVLGHEGIDRDRESIRRHPGDTLNLGSEALGGDRQVTEANDET